MPIRHQVQQGECLLTIASKYRFLDYQTIYNHPANAALKRARPDPSILAPGDIVLIPDKDDKRSDRSTDQTHQYSVRRPNIGLDLIVQIDEKPVANAPYKLVFRDQTLTGSTDGDGRIQRPIDADVKEALLSLEQPPMTWTLQIGGLDPVSSTSGIQARLNNLGFRCGAVDGQMGPQTRLALRQFQEHNGLNPTGDINDETRAKLHELHEG